jgi:hypothetical protein
MGGGWSTPRPSRFTPGEETRYPLYRRLCGPQSRSGRVRKISSQLGFELRTAQLVASRYTFCAFPVHDMNREYNIKMDLKSMSIQYKYVDWNRLGSAANGSQSNRVTVKLTVSNQAVWKLLIFRGRSRVTVGLQQWYCDVNRVTVHTVSV